MPLLIALLVFLMVVLLLLPPRRVRPPMPQQALPVRRRSGSTLAGRVREAGFPGGQAGFLATTGLACLVLFALAHALLHSPLAALALGSLGFLVPYSRLVQRQQKRRQLVEVQFKEVLTSIAGSLRAGASLQTAIERALADTRRIFAQEREAPIVEELEELVGRLHLGVPVDAALAGWRDHLGTDDAADFVSATVAVKERGGNLAEVMGSVAETIAWKIVARAQIRAMTTEKRNEANLLIAAPVAVLIVLSLTSPTYLAPLLTTTIGQALVLLGFLLDILAFLVTRKILASVDL